MNKAIVLLILFVLSAPAYVGIKSLNAHIAQCEHAQAVKACMTDAECEATDNMKGSN